MIYTKHSRWIVAILLVLMVQGEILIAQTARHYASIGKVVRFDERLDALIPPDANIEVLASGFDWTEGPLWVPDDSGGFLIFSEIPSNSVMKWQEGEGLSLFMKPSGFTGIVDYGHEPGSNGLALSPEGEIIFCEHGDRRLSKLTKDGGKITLADHYQGKRFNSPNDATVKSTGDIFFTDPPYGLPQQADDPRRELDFCGVYRLSTAGELTLLTKEFSRPNGIALSPDEATLYVAQSDAQNAIIKAFSLRPDGTIDDGRVLCDLTEEMRTLPGAPDGMEVDQQGNLFATGPGGVYIITPQGDILGRIDTGENTANCAWGDDGSTLYMTADFYVCRIKTKTKGANWNKRLTQ